MKALQRFVAAISMVILVAGLQIFSVKALSHQEDLTLTPAEEYVRQQLLATGQADLANFSQEHTIRGEFILQLLDADPDIQKLPKLEIDNAVIIGDIKASGVSLPFNIEFQNCFFTDGIILNSAHVKIFRIDNSIVNGSVRMGRMVADGDVALYQSVFNGEVTFFGADLKSNLFARGSQFNAVAPDSDSAYPFELWMTQVGGGTEFTDSIFKGDVKADKAKFDGDVNFHNTKFEKPASFKGIEIVGDANFQGAAFKDEVTFESSSLEHDAEFTGAIFDGNVNFDYVSAGRFFDFDQTTLNHSFSIRYSKIGWPYFAKSIFHGRVDFEGIQTSNNLDFADASYDYLDEPFGVQFARVDGTVGFEKFSAPAGLDLAYNQFGNLIISGQEGQKFHFVALDTVKIDGQLVAENIETDKFFANGCVINQLSQFISVKVKYELDLSDTNFGKLVLEKFTWPSSPNFFILRGATYNDLELDSLYADHKFSQRTYEDYYHIIESSAYDAEVYKTFEQFLSDKGFQDLVPEVELAKKQRERKELLSPMTPEWIWSWFLDIFAGYGQRPDRALICSLLVIALGAFVFPKESDLISREKPEEMPPYNPLLYSFALFIPFIDLGIADKWSPKTKGRWMYHHFHKMLGWILMPIAILTFGGFIK